jgi:hypothetical protein
MATASRTADNQFSPQWAEQWFISHGLKPYKGNKLRGNHPLKSDSNSGSLEVAVDPTSPHWGYVNYYAGGQWGQDSISVKQWLIDHKVLPQDVAVATERKPRWTSLTEYAHLHGVHEQVFLDAGWKDGTDRYGNSCLVFTTRNGERFRLRDGGKFKYIQAEGYKACLYGAQRAAVMARQAGVPLVICNGEASVVVAQHYGVPACCQNMGEKAWTAENVSALRSLYNGPILIALDCDEAGRKAARAILDQFHQAGADVRAVDLGLNEHQDLADFCRLWREETNQGLSVLADLAPEPVSLEEEVQQLRADLQRAREQMAFQQQVIQGLQAELAEAKAGKERLRAENQYVTQVVEADKKETGISSGMKQTLIALKKEIDTAAEQGRVKPGGQVIVRQWKMQQESGQHKSTISRHLDVLAQNKVIELEDGYTTTEDGQPRRETRLRITQDLSNPALLHLATTSHGGTRRVKCPECRGTNVLQRRANLCECGLVGEERYHAINVPGAPVVPDPTIHGWPMLQDATTETPLPKAIDDPRVTAAEEIFNAEIVGVIDDTDIPRLAHEVPAVASADTESAERAGVYGMAGTAACRAPDDRGLAAPHADGCNLTQLSNEVRSEVSPSPQVATRPNPMLADQPAWTPKGITHRQTRPEEVATIINLNAYRQRQQ